MVDYCKEPLTVGLFSCSSLVDSSAPLDSFLLHILRALRVSLLGMKSSLSSRVPSLEALSLSLSLCVYNGCRRGNAELSNVFVMSFATSSSSTTRREKAVVNMHFEKILVSEYTIK